MLRRVVLRLQLFPHLFEVSLEIRYLLLFLGDFLVKLCILAFKRLDPLFCSVFAAVELLYLSLLVHLDQLKPLRVGPLLIQLGLKILGFVFSHLDLVA